ncbi:hypothetical protein AcW1_008042 [Taiwanofungus camphoratus]|nr:hypothetical protein AcW1_008042 [Antrodia cinnamomea]
MNLSILDGKSRLIAVTGPTGAGKTTFINRVCGSDLRVGTGLLSCTDHVQIAECVLAHQMVTLIDTPGFDDTYKSQADILNDIASFLERTYEAGRKLSGIIYMHRISDNRIGGIAKENFRLFEKICGTDAMKNVLIVTTMWEDVTLEIGTSREKELASKSTFFKDAIDAGARMTRNYNTAVSAKTVMQNIINNLPQTLQMQREIVDEKKIVPQTEAGIELQNELERQVEIIRHATKQLQAEMVLAAGSKEATYKDEIEELKRAHDEQQSKMKMMENELQKLTKDRRRRNIADHRRRQGNIRGRQRAQGSLDCRSANSYFE